MERGFTSLPSLVERSFDNGEKSFSIDLIGDGLSHFHVVSCLLNSAEGTLKVKNVIYFIDLQFCGSFRLVQLDGGGLVSFETSCELQGADLDGGPEYFLSIRLMRLILQVFGLLYHEEGDFCFTCETTVSRVHHLLILKTGLDGKHHLLVWLIVHLHILTRSTVSRAR